MKHILIFFFSLLFIGSTYAQGEELNEADTCVLYVPNAFSPNGDGMNDCVRFLYSCPLDSSAFHIYNRWGELIFESYDTNDCWYGTEGNRPAQTDVYVWRVLLYKNGSEQKYQGNITVLR